LTRKKKKRLPLNRATWPLVARLLRDQVKPYIGYIVFSFVCMLIVAGATALMAKLMEPVLDGAFRERDFDQLYIVCGVILATFIAKGLANYGQSVSINYVGLRIVADVQIKMFRHLIHNDLAFFHNNSTGNLISRFTNDINLMRGTVSNVLTGIGKDFVTLMFLVALMFYQDWLLAILAFFVFPTAVLPIVRIGRRMRKVSANTQVEMGRFTTLLDETFQGARHVKAYGMEEYETGRAAAVINRIFALTHKAQRTRSASHPIMETLGGIAIVAVMIYGGYQVIEGGKSPGVFFSFVTALLLAYEPMKRLANLNSDMQQGLAATERVFAMLDAAPAIVEKPNAATLEVRRGEIALEGVHFAYIPGQPALRGVTLTVPAGKTVALVGPSGAGKSTILNLIPRFYDVAGGAVVIDGRDVRDVTIESLRASMGLVSQEISLFDDTVRANIAYGRPDASMDEIMEAARNAAAHDFIVDLPQGYDTQVGGRGVKLSGGQRQRLAIARAMLKNAPILLLDEATSALDTESERQVQTALKRLMAGRTTLVIAHRLSTVVDADIIYVIDGGQVRESGSHRELLAKGGVYAGLYATQLSDDTDVETLPTPLARGARA
jgi:subfamily B ATP-binding cassette protein MsbA